MRLILDRLVSVLLIVMGLGLLSQAWAEPDAGLAASPDAGIVERADNDPVGVGLDVINDAKKGNWKAAIAGILSLVMFALKRLREKTTLFSGQRGGAILVMALGLLGFFATGLAAGVDVDLNLFVSGFITTLVAVGGFTWFRDLLFPGKA